MPLEQLDVLRVRKGFVLATRVVTYLIYVYVVVVEIILIIGFFLLLFGANPSAGFTQWAYRNLDRVMEPFRGIFTPIQLGTTSGNVNAVFDTSVLFAMIIYAIVAMVLSALTRWLSGRLRYLDAAEAEAERREQQEEAAAATQASLSQLAAPLPEVVGIEAAVPRSPAARARIAAPGAA